MLNKNKQRKLVRLTRVDDVIPIENADMIELIKIGGWQVVVKKSDGFRKNSPVIYMEIDSVVPAHVPQFDFLKERKYRIRTARLRGQLSQGVAFAPALLIGAGRGKLGNLIIKIAASKFNSLAFIIANFINFDFDSYFGVQKYEEPSVNVPGINDSSGYWPSFLRKTDQERVQNLMGKVFVSFEKREQFEITEKLEGQSLTFFLHPFENNENGEPIFGACSRNYQLQLNTESGQLNDTGILAKKLGIQEILLKLYRETRNFYAIQGERIGPRIQSNYYGLSDFEWYCFDIYDIKKNRYLSSPERLDIVKTHNIPHVPLLQFDYPSADTPEKLLKYLLAYADRQSVLNPLKKAEGVVFKSLNRPNDFTFKVINNSYLLKSNL